MPTKTKPAPSARFDRLHLSCKADRNFRILRQMHPKTILLAAMMTLLAAAAERRFNTDESKVGDHPLPQLLIAEDGSPVKTTEDWQKKRRAEVLALFEKHVFGHTPAIAKDIKVEVTATKADALDGLATRKLLHVSLPGVPKWQGMEVMIYIPNARQKPAPVFVGLSFQGNHAVTTEKDVPLSTRWMRQGKEKDQVVDDRSTELSRGAEASRWPLKMILGAGYAVATAYYGDIEPDHPDGWKDGLRGAASPAGPDTVWKDDDWGAIGAWSFGVSRILDACAEDPSLDTKRAAVIGHSRLGKTSLWAGAQDGRFGLVISNNSGEGGAAIARRDFGETTKIITGSFPHWFCKHYSTYAEPNTPNLPVDSHMLLALAAPRGLYVASALEDTWADPKGEFIGAREAGVVYQLFGKSGVGVAEQPAVEHPAGAQVRYHIRNGKHDVTDYDWQQYLKAATELLP